MTRGPSARYERIATRAQRRLIDYYRTRAVRTLPGPSTVAWDWQLRGRAAE